MKDFDRFLHGGVKDELSRLRDVLSTRNPRLQFGSSGDGEITIRGPNATAYARKYRSRNGWRLALHHDGRRTVSYPETTRAVIRGLQPILAADATTDGSAFDETRSTTVGRAGGDKRLGISDPVHPPRVTAAPFTGDDNGLRTIIHYWSRQHCVGGKWLHPDDEHVLLHERHSFNLDFPAGQYVGDILRAPVVILGANGRYSRRTPGEFRSQDEVLEFLARQKDPSNADWAVSLPRYYHETNYGQWLADGHVALVNACAYRSLKISEEQPNRRVAAFLPSVRFTRSWVRDVLISLAQGGQRLVVVKRGGLWKLNDLRGTAGVVFDPAPVNPSITDSRHPGGPMALTAVRNFLGFDSDPQFCRREGPALRPERV